MPKTGQALAADLSQLYALGKVDLPELAYLYASLNNQVAATSTAGNDAFGGGCVTDGIGGLQAAAYTSWAALRDVLQNALADTATGIEEAGQAIVAIADTYAATDAEAAASLWRVWQHGEPDAAKFNDEQQLPTTPPPVRRSTGSTS